MTCITAFIRRIHIQKRFLTLDKIFVRQASTMPQLIATPEVALVDDKISITAKGLVPEQVVTVTAILEERGTFSSCAHFIADNKGCLDLTSQASTGGTYEGVDAMGLLWSLRPLLGQRNTRLIKSDITKPFNVKLSLLDGWVNWENLSNTPHVLASTFLERWYKHKSVRRIVIREGIVRGTLFLPAGDGPFPGVIDMFGSTGGLVEFRAALLASHGFTAFALGYLAYDDCPKEMDKLDLDYFLQVVDWMSSNPAVTPGGVGVFGVSKGAELGMFMAANSPKVKAVVSVNGAQSYTFIDLKKGGKFFHKGVELDLSMAELTDEGIISRGAYPHWKEVLIPVWESDAKFLMLIGEDDMSWDGQRITEVVKHLSPEKKKNFEIILYPGAGHLIEPPYTPLCRASYHKLVGVNIVWGGSPKLHAAAQEDAWQRALNFLWCHLGQGQDQGQNQDRANKYCSKL